MNEINLYHLLYVELPTTLAPKLRKPWRLKSSLWTWVHQWMIGWMRLRKWYWRPSLRSI
jgi:hypothetical protein